MGLTKIKADGLTADLIDETKLADNSIDSEHYNDGSIDNAHLADDAVGVAELSATGTASSSTFLRGDNSWATVSSGTALTGSTNNTICTVTGADAIQGEANLTFDGDLLSLNKRAVVGNGTDAQIPSRSNTSSYTPQLQVTGAWNDPTHGGTLALNGTSDYPIVWLNSGASFVDNSGAGTITFSIKDGAGNYCNTASIISRIDGTPGNNDSPGEMLFFTTPDGTCNPTQKMVIKPAGNVEITDGDLVIGTAGHGIDFSATSDASGKDSELLDDYEEGTWTPDPFYHTSVATQIGRYTKIGNMVYAYFNVCWYSSASNQQYISNLPFVSSASSGGTGGVARGYQNKDIQDGPIYHIGSNTDDMYFYKDNGVAFPASDGSGNNFAGYVIYQVP